VEYSVVPACAREHPDALRAVSGLAEAILGQPQGDANRSATAALDASAGARRDATVYGRERVLPDEDAGKSAVLALGDPAHGPAHLPWLRSTQQALYKRAADRFAEQSSAAALQLDATGSPVLRLSLQPAPAAVAEPKAAAQQALLLPLLAEPVPKPQVAVEAVLPLAAELLELPERPVRYTWAEPVESAQQFSGLAWELRVWELAVRAQPVLFQPEESPREDVPAASAGRLESVACGLRKEHRRAARCEKGQSSS
jgi:hypothetical protein